MEKDLLNLEEFIQIYYNNTWIKIDNEKALELSNELITFVKNILFIKNDNNE